MSKVTIIVDQETNLTLLNRTMIDTVGFDPEEVVKIDIVEGAGKVWSRIKAVKPSVIMPVGEKALNTLLGVNGITKHAGQILYKDDYPIVPILSPGYIERNHHQLRRFAEDIYTAYQASLGINKIEATNQFVIMETLEEVHHLVEYIKSVGYGAFDFETTLLTDMGTFDPDFVVTCLSISFQQGSAYVLPINHPQRKMSDDDLRAAIDLLAYEFFGDPNITKIGQYVKFDMHCAARLGITVFRGPFHDTMLMHHLLDENSSNKLKEMVRYYYPRFANYESEVSKYSWDSIPLNILAKYNALDADLTFRLYWLFTDMLLEDERLYNLYRNLTAPATVVLFRLEENGMMLDKKYLRDSIEKVGEFIQELEEDMRNNKSVISFDHYIQEQEIEDAIENYEDKLEKEKGIEYKGKSAQNNQTIRIKKYTEAVAQLKTGSLVPTHKILNFGSPVQLVDLLFSVWGFNFLPPIDPWTNKSIRATDKNTLDLLNDRSGFLDNLQSWRQLKKIQGTYLNGLIEKLDGNHYIHGTFNQHGTKTGRLSSDKPNLQNVISRTKYKKVEEAVKFVKGAFIVPEGYTLMQADYSQAELRIIAHYADETAMLEAYAAGEDLHERTAANARNYTLEEFRALPEKDFKQYRFEAKAENFGFIYRISPEGFREYARVQYGIRMSLQASQKKRDAFFQHYPRILKYHDLYVNKARKFKYVRTLFGSKIRIPEIDSFNRIKRGHAERNAINGPIQGTAGQMTIFALVLLKHRLGQDILMVNTVHDSILFYCLNSKVEEKKAIIEETMENLPLEQYFDKVFDKVKMKVDFETSKESWEALS